jgi:hypothetical protein
VLSSEQLGGPTLPHFATITTGDQVQVYESIMQDAAGQATYSLLRGATYRKDNRLLPLGRKKDHGRGQLTAPVATDGDADFVAGTDVTHYVVDGVDGRSPFSIKASLFYQVLGSRYATELLAHDVAEMREFAQLYAAADPRPELVAQAEMTVEQGSD